MSTTLRHYAIFVLIGLMNQYLIGAFIRWDILWWGELPSWSEESRGAYIFLLFAVIALSVLSGCAFMEYKRKEF